MAIHKGNLASIYTRHNRCYPPANSKKPQHRFIELLCLKLLSELKDVSYRIVIADTAAGIIFELLVQAIPLPSSASHSQSSLRLTPQGLYDEYFSRNNVIVSTLHGWLIHTKANKLLDSPCYFLWSGCLTMKQQFLRLLVCFAHFFLAKCCRIQN